MKIATALSRKVGGSTPEIGKSFGVERGIVFTTLSPEHQQPVVVLVNADDGNIALNIYANENLSDSYESINTFLYGPDGYTSKRVAVEDMAETIKEIWKMVDGYAESWQEEGGGFEIDEAPRRSSHHSPDAFQGRPDPGVPASDLSHLHNPSRAGNVIVSNIEDFNRLLIERLEQLGRTDAPALARKYKKLASAYFGASRTPASTAEEILDMEQRRRAPSKRQRAKR